MRIKLLLLSLLFAFLFTYFSYSVAKERWQKIDFDTTVKLQDRIPQKFDGIFSYFSLIGSAEITVGFCLAAAFLYLLKKRWLAIAGWLMIIPATAAEVFGKLILFHPGPPVFFHRSLTPTSLPSCYVHTFRTHDPDYFYCDDFLLYGDFLFKKYCAAIFYFVLNSAFCSFNGANQSLFG